MPLLLLFTHIACFSPEVGVREAAAGCPTVEPWALTIGQEELGMPIHEALVVRGDTVLTSATWLPQEGLADAVLVPDISALDVVREAWIGLLIQPGGSPLLGLVVLTTHDGCELQTLIQTQLQTE